MKESRDKKNAEEDLKAKQQARAKLESQFQADIAALEYNFDPLNENLENISVEANKSDIDVQLLALVWVAR